MSSSLGTNFYPKLVQVSSEVGMAPEDLVAVMISESGMKPSAGNPNGGAVGLIQFMPNTLKGLKFQGSQKDFGQLEGEKQLDYIKQYISNQMKLNGGPFTSAAQYYVANFFPIALKLPGVKKGDPSTVFVEENPAVITENGKKYSKKYYDIGIKLNPHSEISAYKANPLFHGSVSGAITYADMIKQIEKNKKSNAYLQAINAMKQQTNYMPNEKNKPAYIANNKNKEVNLANRVIDMAESFLKAVAEECKDLPQNYLLTIHDDRVNSSEFSKIVCMAIKEEFGYKCIIGNKQILIHAKNDSLEQLKNIISGIRSSFKIATCRIGSINISFDLKKTDLLLSDFNPLNNKIASQNHRRFLLKFF